MVSLARYRRYFYLSNGKSLCQRHYRFVQLICVFVTLFPKSTQFHLCQTTFHIFCGVKKNAHPPEVFCSIGSITFTLSCNMVFPIEEEKYGRQVPRLSARMKNRCVFFRLTLRRLQQPLFLLPLLPLPRALQPFPHCNDLREALRAPRPSHLRSRHPPA